MTFAKPRTAVTTNMYEFWRGVLNLNGECQKKSNWIDPTHPQYDSLRLLSHAFHHLKLQS